MITYFKIMVAWCWDSKCSSWERSLAFSLSLQVLASSIIAACYKTDVEHYFSFLSFFFPVKSKILLDSFRLRKIGSNVRTCTVPPFWRIADWMTATTETNFLAVVEAGSLRWRCLQGWFLLRATKGGFVPSFSPWLINDHLLLVSSLALPSVSVLISSYKDISHVGLGPTLVTSF